jgi:hypothetical protein
MSIRTFIIPRMAQGYRVWYNNGAERFWCCRANTPEQAREFFGTYFGNPNSITRVEEIAK